MIKKLPQGRRAPFKPFTRVAAVHLFLSLMALALVPMAGRLLSAAPQKDQNTVLRVSTRLVQVNVSVQTRGGEPVQGLTKDDFELKDEGKLQKISVFSVQSDELHSEKIKPLPPGTFSNRTEQQAAVPASVTVILLDALNTHFEDQTFAKKQVAKFLEQIKPEEHIAIYTLGTNVRVLHDFTSDSKTLLAALQTFTTSDSQELKSSEPKNELAVRTVITPNTGSAPNSTPGSTTAITVGLEDYIKQTLQQSADWYSMDRTLRTLDGLKSIARRLASVPGRKNLIWVSGSFPFTVGAGTANEENVLRGQRSFGPEMERAERFLNDANIAIYPVDARGLVSPFGMNPNLSTTRNVSARLPFENSSIQGMGQLTPTHDTMDTLATDTGGRAFYGSNDIMSSIRTAMNDAKVTYTLGYYPSNSAWDGKFHKISVRVRRSGTKVLCRKGYFALAEAQRGEKEQTDLLREAASDPLDATAIGLTVQTQGPPQKSVLPVTLDIDLHSLTLVKKEGRWRGDVVVLFAQMGSKGEMLNGLSQPLHLNLTDQEYKQLLNNGLSISGKLLIVSATERIKVIALDETSFLVGSVTVPLKKTAPAASTGG